MRENCFVKQYLLRNIKNRLIIDYSHKSHTRKIKKNEKLYKYFNLYDPHQVHCLPIETGPLLINYLKMTSKLEKHLSSLRTQYYPPGKMIIWVDRWGGKGAT